MAPEFQYSARTGEGDAVSGELQADSREEAARRLRQRGFYVTSLNMQEEGGGGLFTREINLGNISFLNRGFGTAELAHFSKQFSVLVDAGIPLVQSLEIMRDQTEAQHVREMLGEVRRSVEAGQSFSDALSEHPKYFPDLFVHLVRAGETGGVLDEVLEELSDYYQRRDRINSEVKGALYYPITILVVALVVIMILLTFVVPTITDMLAGMGGEMPLPTQILIGVSGFLSSYWWAVFGGIALILLLLRFYAKTSSGSRRFDALLLKIPVIGDLLRKVIISRFANTLALLLASGVNLVNALPVLENIVGNQIIKEVLEEARARVREGTDLSRPLSNSGEFPPIVIQMIQVGEQTGNMEDMLNRLSDYYEIEVENAIEGGISLIEPAIIVMMALVVGGVVASIIMPMFEIYTQI